MYHVSAQGVDERMINVHNYYYYFSSNAQVNNSHYVFFGDPTVYDWDDDDGTKAAHNWDRDGSLTGTPNTYIVRNRPFFTGPECLHRPDWHMSVCPYRYIKVGEWSCICLGCCHCCGGGVRRWGFPFVRSFVRSSSCSSSCSCSSCSSCSCSCSSCSCSSSSSSSSQQNQHTRELISTRKKSNKHNN